MFGADTLLPMASVLLWCQYRTDPAWEIKVFCEPLTSGYIIKMNRCQGYWALGGGALMSRKREDGRATGINPTEHGYPSGNVT